MPMGIHHLAVQVRDLPGAERFYCGVLGFAVLRRWPSSLASPAAGSAEDATPGERALWLALGDDGRTFLALERVSGEQPTAAEEPDARAHRPGHHLLAFGIEAAERRAWENRLRAAAVLVTHRTAYTLYFTDPEGNRLGLSHYPCAESADET
jgi:glyoxylase I family protein